jgi:predicted aconitase/predicted aconitase with swiveling domain
MGSDIEARSLMDGTGSGPVLWSDTGLSFWGGVDPATGEIIDRHHPLNGRSIAGTVLALPRGRGSCSGSVVMLELLMNGMGPAALVFEAPDEVLVLGVIVAEEMFGRSIPVLSVGRRFAALAGATHAVVANGRLAIDGSPSRFEDAATHLPALPDENLTERDRAILGGEAGAAARTALRIVLRTAALSGATALADVTRVHIDACIYTGPAGLRFAETMRDAGGRVVVPTTLNAISVDERRWRGLGVDPALGVPASALAEAYVAMGARASFTCAPYVLDAPPGRGELIAWSESNAVAYANSVLAARTAKTPDLLDLCIALTGRAPLSGCMVESNRRATLAIAVDQLGPCDDSLFPLLGYVVGALARDRIPVVTGLEGLAPSPDDLKAFGAAFATTASAPMFHLAGITPEADTLGRADRLPTARVSRADLLALWQQFNAATEPDVDLVCLGSPHLSVAELRRLGDLCRGRRKARATAITATCGRDTLARAEAEGIAAELRAFGVELLTDTCWCMIGEPVIPLEARRLMTNSGKYAHYGPGLVGRQVRFAGLEACVEAACRGALPVTPPAWLAG